MAGLQQVWSEMALVVVDGGVGGKLGQGTKVWWRPFLLQVLSRVGHYHCKAV